VSAMRELPKESWRPDQAAQIVDRLLIYVAKSGRGSQQLIRFGQELAAALPADRAEKARQGFDEFLVQTIVVKAVPKQLRFEPPFFVVEAGRPVEIVLENPDEMPHNLLVTKPGALEAVGKAGDAMASKPDGFKKQFVPEMPEVLWATPLINKGETARVRFQAPGEAGAYPYVCTFPGHWMTMNGQMFVRSRSEGPAGR
ncbi:MAG: plastocyanin/azurin family copper-binding protein, partial [Bryobacteraceae bacterium]